MQTRYIFIKEPGAQADKLVIATILVICVLLEIFAPWFQS